MILLIDNYDSFAYNVYQLVALHSRGHEVKVVRNDAVTVGEVVDLAPKAIVLSPGPGRPDAAGICEDLIKQEGEHIPILGVCLGHEAICEVYGGRITYANELMHGKQSEVFLTGGSMLWDGLGESMLAARYHSLAADSKAMPECLRIIAHTADGEIMAVQHERFPVYGLQFHPESVLTPQGGVIMENFVKMVSAR